MSEMQQEAPQDVQKNRGKGLTAFLILNMIATLFTGISYLFNWETISSTFSNIPSWGLYGFIGIITLNIVLIIGIWKFKKWGVYGICATTLIMFGINLSLGISIITCIFGLIGAAIIICLVQPIWNQFE